MSAAVHSDIACSRLLRIRSQTARRPERGMNDAQTFQNLTMHWPCWQEKQSSAANSAPAAIIVTQWQNRSATVQLSLVGSIAWGLWASLTT